MVGRFARRGWVLAAVVLLVGCSDSPSGPTTGDAPSTAWPMFHADEAHTGVVHGSGQIDEVDGPESILEYRIFDELSGVDSLGLLRWTSTLALGDVNGDGAVDVVVTTPDWATPLTPTSDGKPLTDGVAVLTYSDGRLSELWRWTSQLAPGEAGLDTYSPALVDADGDGLVDVVFTARDGYVRALSGRSGDVIWEFDMGRITEAGPMLSDLDGDGAPEVIVVTDCVQGPICAGSDAPARLVVLSARGSGRITEPLWEATFGYKMDSAEPAVATVHGIGSVDDKVILLGTWGGQLLAVWRDAATATVTSSAFDLSGLMSEVGHGNPPVIRTSPLVWDGPDGPEVFFGWLPSDEDAGNARFTGLRLGVADGRVTFDVAFNIDRYDIWKSSPTLVPTGHAPIIVAGYGLGIGPDPTQSGPVGLCVDPFVSGGVVAVSPQSGDEVWRIDYDGEEGNLRASAAVADIDGDGRLEVVEPSGCSGRLHVFDAVTGDEEWTLDLGPVTQTSPSVGDVNGDGFLDIVIGSYDGLVRVITG